MYRVYDPWRWRQLGFFTEVDKADEESGVNKAGHVYVLPMTDLKRKQGK